MWTFLKLSVDHLLIDETGLQWVKSKYYFFISMENFYVEIADKFVGAINITKQADRSTKMFFGRILDRTRYVLGF